MSKKPILTMVERGAGLRSQVVSAVDNKTLHDPILENVDLQPTMMTDTHAAFKAIEQSQGKPLTYKGLIAK